CDWPSMGLLICPKRKKDESCVCPTSLYIEGSTKQALYAAALLLNPSDVVPNALRNSVAKRLAEGVRMERSLASARLRAVCTPSGKFGLTEQAGRGSSNNIA